jgi:hypothetical protein
MTWRRKPLVVVSLQTEVMVINTELIILPKKLKEEMINLQLFLSRPVLNLFLMRVRKKQVTKYELILYLNLVLIHLVVFILSLAICFMSLSNYFLFLTKPFNVIIFSGRRKSRLGRVSSFLIIIHLLTRRQTKQKDDFNQDNERPEL